jgi:hypothetical protein
VRTKSTASADKRKTNFPSDRFETKTAKISYSYLLEAMQKYCNLLYGKLVQGEKENSAHALIYQQNFKEPS